jgi:ApbE superfamily uncharacterized protein (UPF0280 family)
MSAHQDRTYRRLVSGEGLVGFRTAVKESDLWVLAERDLSAEVLRALTRCRRQIEDYAARTPGFLTSLAPWPDDDLAPAVVRLMIRAGGAAGVGPLAAVAGAVAETVGLEVLALSPRLIIENGGDVFISSDRAVTVALWAGDSPLSGRVGLALAPYENPFGVCTSSGTVGHSLSFGRADAVCVVASSAALADAVATAAANRVQRPADLNRAVAWALELDNVQGAVAVLGDKLAAGGQVEMVRL